MDSSDALSRCRERRLNNALAITESDSLDHRWLLYFEFSANFDDARTDIISLLLCDWLQHATTLYEESKN